MADEIPVYENNDQRQGCNWDEDHVYADLETITPKTRDEKKNEDQNFTGGDCREVKCYRVAVVSLGLLCVLLLAIIISVVIKGTAERKQLQNEMQLQKFSYSNLTQEQDHLQATITILTQEKEQLQAKNTILAQEKDQLEERNSALAQQITKLFKSICEWKCFGSSCYCISSDKRSWNDSQEHCTDLGVHLVIIDSKEEQEFIISQGKRAWIGLSDLETEGVWKWVDGKHLDNNVGYWNTGEPNNSGGNENCAEIWPEKKGWNDSICKTKKHYICEKQTS